MKEKLLQLGFSKKEADVYLALLELGTQAGSVIAKKTGFPKATVLFLLNNLAQRGYIRKSQKGRVQYFYADPQDLKSAKEKQLAEEANALKEVSPLLEEIRSPFSSPPKVTFFEGIEGCRKAYSMLLESSGTIHEFGAHNDLLAKLGEEFMKQFVAQRVRNKIHIRAICKRSKLNLRLKALYKKSDRKISLYPEKIGELYSSIAVFDSKVLLLNLYHDPFGILIENAEVAETLKTIHALAWK